MEKFKTVHHIHDFIRAQMVAGTKFSLMWVKLHKPKLDLDKVAKGFLLKEKKHKRFSLTKFKKAVEAPADLMITKVLEADAGFFKNFRYDESTQEFKAARVTLEKWKCMTMYVKILVRDL